MLCSNRRLLPSLVIFLSSVTTSAELSAQEPITLVQRLRTAKFVSLYSRPESDVVNLSVYSQAEWEEKAKAKAKFLGEQQEYHDASAELTNRYNIARNEKASAEEIAKLEQERAALVPPVGLSTRAYTYFEVILVGQDFLELRSHGNTSGRTILVPLSRVERIYWNDVPKPAENPAAPVPAN